MAPGVQLGEREGRNDQILLSTEEQPGARIMVGIGCVQGGQERARVEDERHAGPLPGWAGDRLGGGLASGATIVRPRHPDAREATGAQARRLLLDRFSEHRRERAAAPARLGLEGGQGRAVGTHGRATAMHDA